MQISKMNELEKLYYFMDNYKNPKESHTHVLTYAPHTIYNIPDNKYPTFINLYATAIIANYQPNIAEQHKEFGPIIIDIKLVNLKSHKKIHIIKTVIMIYNI